MHPRMSKVNSAGWEGLVVGVYVKTNVLAAVEVDVVVIVAVEEGVNVVVEVGVAV